MHRVDIRSLFRNIPHPRHLFQARFWGKTMKDCNRKALAQGVCDRAWPPSAADAAAVSITIKNDGTINIFCERPVKLVPPQET